MSTVNNHSAIVLAGADHYRGLHYAIWVADILEFSLLVVPLNV